MTSPMEATQPRPRAGSGFQFSDLMMWSSASSLVVVVVGVCMGVVIWIPFLNGCLVLFSSSNDDEQLVADTCRCPSYGSAVAVARLCALVAKCAIERFCALCSRTRRRVRRRLSLCAWPSRNSSMHARSSSRTASSVRSADRNLAHQNGGCSRRRGLISVVYLEG
jgi:hypothetical protein